MEKQKRVPCDDWSEKLTTPKDELTGSDREALESHLASCPTCRLMDIDDTMISKLIQALPMPVFPRGLPSRLSRLINEKEIKQNTQEIQDASVFLFHAEEAPTKVLKSEERRAESNDKSMRASSISKQLPLKPDERLSQLNQQSKEKSRPKEDIHPQQSSNGGYHDRVLTCRDCGNDFTFSAGEQEFYASKGLINTPGRCPSCRVAARKGGNQGGGGYRGREPRHIYTVTCADCGIEIQVPFLPREGRPVYCCDCYQSHGSNARHQHSQNFLDK